MKIYSVNDPEFKPYGRVVTGLEAAKAEILQALATTPLPEATDLSLIHISEPTRP